MRRKRHGGRSWERVIESEGETGRKRLGKEKRKRGKESQMGASGFEE